MLPKDLLADLSEDKSRWRLWLKKKVTEEGALLNAFNGISALTATAMYYEDLSQQQMRHAFIEHQRQMNRQLQSPSFTQQSTNVYPSGYVDPITGRRT